jgi:hypothetical protein
VIVAVVIAGNVPALGGRRSSPIPSGVTVLTCTKTGRVLSRGDSLRVLTPLGFTEGVLDTVTLAGAIRVRGTTRTHDVPLDDVEAVRRLAG